MYTKLFGSIVHSTIWRESDAVRLVWVTMLALADKGGCVWASVPGLADVARVNIEECRHALDRLSSPDPDSRTQVDEGRRIEAIDGGWWLINHAKWQAIKNMDERREQVRLAVQRHRNKTTDPVINVIKRNRRKPLRPDQTSVDQIRPDQQQPSLDGFDDAWACYPKRAGANNKADARKAWDARIKAGVEPRSITEGVVRYAAYIRASGKEGTEYVKQAATFFGPSEHWKYEWPIPQLRPVGGVNGGGGRNDAALDAYLEKHGNT